MVVGATQERSEPWGGTLGVFLMGESRFITSCNSKVCEGAHADPSSAPGGHRSQEARNPKCGYHVPPSGSSEPDYGAS